MQLQNPGHFITKFVDIDHPLSHAITSHCSTSNRLTGYPPKTVRIVVALTAGGPTDMIARIVARPLSASLQQQVIVDNRPGAAGNIGAELVEKSAPDGYTLFVAGPGNFAINVSLFPKLPYHPIRDFAPVALMGFAPYRQALLGHKSESVTTDYSAAEIEHLIAQAGKVTMGSQRSSPTLTVLRRRAA